MKYIKSILLLVTFLFPLTHFAQTTFKGTVKQDKSGELLAGVNVYLAQTTIGTTTDKNGRYMFSTGVEGVYELVFSFVGFHKKVISVNLDSRKRTIQKDIELTPEVLALPEIEVVTSNKQWLRNLNLFKEIFIGSYGFAENTKIVNPWVLEFDRSDKSELLATTVQTLIIENHALGYRLYIELDDFRWKTSGSDGYFIIYPRFEEMMTQDKNVSKYWIRNRKKAYLGSFQHFLTSLYREKLSRDNFSLSQPAYLLQLDESEAKFEFLGSRGFSKSLQRSIKGFRLLSQVEVVHGEISGYITKKYGISPDLMRSTLVPNSPNGIFFVDPSGNLLDPRSLQVGGDWGGHRIAYRLPMDYSPN